MMIRCCLYATLMLLGFSTAQAQPSAEDVPAPSIDISKYSWMHPELNMLQFYDRGALVNFYKKWKNTSKEKLSIIHFGDSHCQGDVLPGKMRKRFHEMHGDGGRGLMFPTSTAKTYSSIEYSTSHSGSWTAQRSITMRPKLPMGIRGMTCRTEYASSSLSFSFRQDVPKEHNLLKIFCKKTNRSYDITVEAGGKRIPVSVDASDNKPYVEVKIPAITDRRLKLNVVKNNPGESEFEFYGLSLETDKNSGVVYHNAGVGAARFNSLLYQSLLWEHMPHLKPDVVILDFGTNDFLYYDRINPDLESEIKTIIDKMRKSVPDVSIILTSTSDLYYKRRNCTAGEPFSDLIHRIAAEKSCAVYDWYWISGGQGTMLNWTREGLAQSDLVHLTVKGYRVKGDLFFDAINNTMNYLETHPESNEFFFRIDKLKEEQKKIRAKVQPQPVAATSYKAPAAKIVPASTAGRTKYIHKIKKGESLYSIGRKYHVTVYQLRSWNGMRSNTIYAGKTLVVYVKK